VVGIAPAHSQSFARRYDACGKEVHHARGGIARLLLGGGLAVAVAFHGAGGKANPLAQTSTVTNCMMACNSQAANCQTTSIGAATTESNASQSTVCQLSCTTQQVTCQTTCARTSPSP
jgi:hypothetical protein